jgi:L-seryl-tRNA(Ser) seleniumtransferase
MTPLPGRIVNAAGTLTRLSGAPLAPGVAEAMAEAEAQAVDMVQLHAHASARIAAATGAESGLATSGAAAGLLLAAAACLARDDVARMNALPRTGPRREIVLARSHRNGYDHALRTAGARLVEVGLPDPVAGAGVRDVEPWDYAAALGPRSAAVHFTARPGNRALLPEVVAVAREAGVPVIVDAAAELPPAANLRRFIAEGADLVVFSGGKVMGGPAGSGLLAGRRDLIASAALQCLDLDLPLQQFAPPPAFIDLSRLRGLPRHGVGRAAKLGKGELAGLLAALEHFASEPDAARHARWLAVCRELSDEVPGRGEILHEEETDRVPLLRFAFADPEAAASADAALRARPLPVHLRGAPEDPAALLVHPVSLRPAELPLLAEALRAVLV